MQIPIKFQGQQPWQSREQQQGLQQQVPWQQSQQQPWKEQQYQQPQETFGKEKEYQQQQFGKQLQQQVPQETFGKQPTQEMFGRQPRESVEKPWQYQQGVTGLKESQQYLQPQETFGKEKEYQQQLGGKQSPTTFGYQQPTQQQQMYGTQQQQVSKGWQIVNVTKNDVSTADICALHLLLRLSGISYIKEHVLMKLCTDNNGMIREWHKNVTIKNLDALEQIAKSWNLTLPFSESLENREKQIKQALSNVPKVITESEALSDICASAHLLERELAIGGMASINNEFKNVCRNSCHNLCQEYAKLKECICSSDEFFPIPFAKTVVVKEGVQSRR
jgi:hypothetical protein